MSATSSSPTANSTQAGYEVAKELFKSIGGEGVVVHIKGLATPTDDARTAGVMQAAKEFPGVKLVGDLRGDWVREKAREVMLSMVTAHPDMKADFAQNDSMALGALSVLKEHGLSNVKLAGIDGIPEALQEVAKGGQYVATNTSLPPYQVGFAAVLLFDCLRGYKPKLSERLIYTDWVTATAANAASISAKIYEAKELPFDWVKMSRTLHPDDWDPQNKIAPIDPSAHWGTQPGKDKLNKAYSDGNWQKEFDEVTKMYADRYKSGPFLCGRKMEAGSGAGGGNAIVLQGVSKASPGVKALDGVSFSLNRNSVLSLVGENGAGKSTVLSITNGSVRPDSGTLSIGPHPVRFGHPTEAARHGVATCSRSRGSSPPFLSTKTYSSAGSGSSWPPAASCGSGR